jgi:diguanylate cyclase (GGDEF)-like protein
MEKNGEKNSQWFEKTYFLIVLLISSIFFGCLLGGGHRETEYGIEGFRQMEQDWTVTPDGAEYVDFTDLAQYTDADAGITQMYFRIPQLTEATSLVFWSKNVSARVLLDGKCVYETDVLEGRTYNKTAGNRWNIVTFEVEDSGKLVTLQAMNGYANKAPIINRLYWGDRAAIILYLIKDKAAGIVVALSMLIVGTSLVIVDIPIHIMKIDTGHAILYLGIFAGTVAVWSLIETDVLQFLVKDFQLLQTVSNICLIIAVIPLMMYMDHLFDFLKHPSARLFLAFYYIYVAVAVALHWMGIKDLHEMLPVARLFLCISGALLLYWVVWKVIVMRRQGQRSATMYLRLAGVIVMFAALTFEMLRFETTDVIDSATVMRPALLIFILCFGVSDTIELSFLIRQGMSYKFVSKLAYTDGLTELGNRTAYLEQLEKYRIDAPMELGIVFLDVNNLKKVNDTYGHEEGDNIIKAVAEVIGNSFGKYGSAYRIGGDEFCILLEGENARGRYEEAKEQFHDAIKNVNQRETGFGTLQIAHGFAVCDSFRMEELNYAIDLADKNMYLDKARLKRAK